MTDIQLCPNCKGNGEQLVYEHRETYRDECKTCLGSGRIIVETKITIKPYIQKIDEVDL